MNGKEMVGFAQSILSGRMPALQAIATGRDATVASLPARLGATQVHLTERQLAVLGLLCEGLSNKLICRRLNIASGTVKCHITSIFRALNVSSRVQAFVVAQRLGLIGSRSAPAPQRPHHKQPIVLRVALSAEADDVMPAHAELLFSDTAV